MCASKEEYPGNLACICIEKELLCGFSIRLAVLFLITWCEQHCVCGPNTKVSKDRFTKDLDGVTGSAGSKTENTLEAPVSPSGRVPKQFPAYHPSTGSTGVSTHSCSKKCSNIKRDCDRLFEGNCKCYAPPAASLFWHSGGCGLAHHLPKRDLAQHRRSYYLNATAQFAPSNKIPALAPPGPHPDLAVQLASGLLPSPCNASYVSFACSDSKDGIVHEPLQNWLGALLPEDAKELPPVPKEFLRIHHGKEGKMQVLRPAVD
ncbi:hypothetical protein MMC22_005515 [Lobaria immixta]|nr:hypothetical protein [Lobaria immixta]